MSWMSWNERNMTKASRPYPGQRQHSIRQAIYIIIGLCTLVSYPCSHQSLYLPSYCWEFITATWSSKKSVVIANEHSRLKQSSSGIYPHKWSRLTEHFRDFRQKSFHLAPRYAEQMQAQVAALNNSATIFRAFLFGTHWPDLAEWEVNAEHFLRKRHGEG